ncbi:MAG: hypothetical protein CMM77_05625 [Rhodospirillaceae bacterium]|nr:hypothetical protein [Rhodospirillaceae bacterium]
MFRMTPLSRIRPAAAAVLIAQLAGLVAAGPAQAADAGRITGPDINRPGVALPLDRQNSGSVVRQSQSGSGEGAEGNSGAPSQVQMTKQPSLFIHPVRGFSLPLPAGVAVSHRGKEMHVAVRSPKGYVMNLQTGDSNALVPLPAMLGRLESHYLGERGPWLRKLSDGAFNVAGLPGVDATYQGHRTKTRVVIARGNRTDFVFTFTAPLDLYAEHGQIFDWVLTNFTPGDGERPAQAPVADAKGEGVPKSAGNVPVRAGDSVASMAAGRPKPRPSAAPPPDMNRFVEPGYGFLMDYPKQWTVSKPTAFTATFSGPEGAASHDAVVSVQNVNPAGARTGDESAVMATADLLKALESGTQGMTVLGEGKLAESPGSQFIARYEYAGKVYRKWAVVVPRPEGTIAHIWSFTAPEGSFDSYRPVAESMLWSWTLTQ